MYISRAWHDLDKPHSVVPTTHAASIRDLTFRNCHWPDFVTPANFVELVNTEHVIDKQAGTLWEPADTVHLAGQLDIPIKPTSPVSITRPFWYHGVKAPPASWSPAQAEQYKLETGEDIYKPVPTFTNIEASIDPSDPDAMRRVSARSDRYPAIGIRMAITYEGERHERDDNERNDWIKENREILTIRLRTTYIPMKSLSSQACPCVHLLTS